MPIGEAMFTQRSIRRFRPDAIPMAGFPHPALESYLAKIVSAGLPAAVCEQVEDAKQAKVDRPPPKVQQLLDLPIKVEPEHR